MMNEYWWVMTKETIDSVIGEVQKEHPNLHISYELRESALQSSPDREKHVISVNNTEIGDFNKADWRSGVVTYTPFQQEQLQFQKSYAQESVDGVKKATDKIYTTLKKEL